MARRTVLASRQNLAHVSPLGWGAHQPDRGIPAGRAPAVGHRETLNVGSRPLPQTTRGGRAGRPCRAVPRRPCSAPDSLATGDELGPPAPGDTPACLVDEPVDPAPGSPAAGRAVGCRRGTPEPGPGSAGAECRVSRSSSDDPGPGPFRLISRWNQSPLQAHFSLDKTPVERSDRGVLQSALPPLPALKLEQLHAASRTQT